MTAFRDIRIIPVVMAAIIGFAVLKVAGLVIDGGYVFDYQPDSAQPSWALPMRSSSTRNWITSSRRKSCSKKKSRRKTNN